MKYIIIDDGGLEVPVIFPPHWDHAQTAQKFPGRDVISAGFVKRDGSGYLYVTGKSVSLGLESRPDDLGIIIKQLDFQM